MLHNYLLYFGVPLNPVRRAQNEEPPDIAGNLPLPSVKVYLIVLHILSNYFFLLSITVRSINPEMIFVFQLKDVRLHHQR